MAPDGLSAAAEAAEESAFDSVWVTDHLMVPAAMAGVYGAISEALVSLGFLAGRTKRVQLGVSALVVPQRNPFVTLKQVTTLDFLSGGRLVLAVAPGWLESEFETLGAEFARRGSRLDAWLDVVAAAFEQMPGPIRHEGDLHIRDAWLAPSGPAKRDLELWVAGAGDAALHRAARMGVWHPVALTPAKFSQLAGRYRELRPDGRIVMRLSALLADRADPHGTDERGRPAVVGPPGWVIERLDEFVALGCDGFVVNLGHDAPGLDERVRQFSAEVWPHVTRAR